MKKVLFGIITLIGVGLSFCNADSQCISGNLTDSYGSSNGKNVFVGFELNQSSSYVFDSFVLQNTYCRRSDSYTNFSDATLTFCYTGNVISNWSSIDINRDFICSDIPFFCTQGSGYPPIATISLNSLNIPVGSKYIFFNFYNSSSNFGYYKYNFSYNNNFYSSQFDNLLTYISISSLYPIGNLKSVCYFASSSPKFKVNYGNTSYEYTLEDNLSIYLKSPVIQSGNIFTYNGSTGLNLFYNGTSQWYNKSNLYLDSMFWYNNNIFTPICL